MQGLDDPAPLHPNARGQLVLALAVERAILAAEPADPAREGDAADGPATAGEVEG
ncbi:MAG TPA: hypothetical protein VLA82_11220 [Actinomycetota bacterium]|nr:hypothetical protein [Actinomycetota bacterium]